MSYIAVNIVPIVLATLAGLATGWLALRRARRPLPRAGALLAALAAQFWLAAILAGALILAPPQVRAAAGGWTIALGTAGIVWAGFLLPAFAASLPVLGHHWRTVAAVAAAWLAAMLAMAAVLQLHGLAPPPGAA